MYFHHVSSCFIFCSLVEWCEELRREGISVAVEEFGAEGIAELEEKSWGVLPDPWILECQDAENLTFLEYLTPYLVHPRWFLALCSFSLRKSSFFMDGREQNFKAFRSMSLIDAWPQERAERKTRRYHIHFLLCARKTKLPWECWRSTAATEVWW